MSTTQTEFTIYTDGGCIGNPGPGGYGAVILTGKQRKELSGGYRRTTNNRMELMAAVEHSVILRRAAPSCSIPDSRYLVDGMTRGWAERWRANNWRKADKQKALNVDLWRVSTGAV